MKLRLPVHWKMESVSVNGRPASLGGPKKDTVIIATAKERTFEVAGQYSA